MASTTRKPSTTAKPAAKQGPTAYAKKQAAMASRAERFDAKLADAKGLTKLQANAANAHEAAFIGKLVAYYAGQITEAQRPKQIDEARGKELREQVVTLLGQPSAQRVGTVKVIDVASLLG